MLAYGWSGSCSTNQLFAYWPKEEIDKGFWWFELTCFILLQVSEKVVVITGGTSGLGFEIGREETFNKLWISPTKAFSL